MGRRILPGRPGVQRGGGRRRGAPPRGGPRRDGSSPGPPPQDEDSLWTLLHIAHEASGIAGTPRLASRRIIISSAVVSDHRAGDTTADIDFLNSFFLDDLATVQVALADGRCPSALSEYLTADALLPTDLRSDVMTEHAVVDAGVGIDRLPKGRWPSNPEHGLALRQQFAVNRALDDLSGTRGLMGVNGPPGTGKTTMLRDILAGNIVERARRLASLQRPEHAFTTTTHRWSSGDGYSRTIRQLRPELTGFEMVVASANNAAVENISVEIPAREAIAARWRDDADYFADIASALLAAWQTFFLAVPMVSTTFASVGRMFAGLGAESLGWLLIDEAGQAPPQYAVGGIWRAQRVIAVGDPLQLQPVVTMPRKAQRDIAAAFGVSPTWIPPRASVQTLADRMSRDGTALRQGEESVWVSMPLTVHRRCDDPMFDLCNKMAYDGMMVSAVHRRLDDPDHPDLFDGPGGEPRIPASQWLDMPATMPGDPSSGRSDRAVVPPAR